MGKVGFNLTQKVQWVNGNLKKFITFRNVAVQPSTPHPSTTLAFIRVSVNGWPRYFFNIWPFRTMKICPKV